MKELPKDNSGTIRAIRKLFSESSGIDAVNEEENFLITLSIVKLLFNTFEGKSFTENELEENIQRVVKVKKEGIQVMVKMLLENNVVEKDKQGKLKLSDSAVKVVESFEKKAKEQR